MVKDETSCFGAIRPNKIVGMKMIPEESPKVAL
jgi:hypothetical protein